MKTAAEAHPDKQVALWFMDEARVGQKGRTTHRWWVRGERPPGLADRRFETVEELRLALQRFRETYNRTWIVERHGYRTPAQVRAAQLEQPMAA